MAVPARLVQKASTTLNVRQFEKGNDQQRQKIKLRAKAGECRYLVPFCVYVSGKVQHLDQHWMTVAWLFQYLYKLQMMVSGLAEWDAKEAAEFFQAVLLFV